MKGKKKMLIRNPMLMKNEIFLPKWSEMPLNEMAPTSKPAIYTAWVIALRCLRSQRRCHWKISTNIFSFVAFDKRERFFLRNLWCPAGIDLDATRLWFGRHFSLGRQLVYILCLPRLLQMKHRRVCVCLSICFLTVFAFRSVHFSFFYRKTPVSRL